jgi:hypothetical protein
MSPWMRSACRIVCWCWIWLHRRVVNLGCGCGGDGNGVGVLVSLPPLALLGGVSVPGRCHRAVRLSPWRVIGALYSEWPSTQPPVGPGSPGSLDVARTVSSPSFSFFPLCSSLSLRRRQTADGRATRLAAVWRPLAASGGLWRCRVAHDPWSRNCQREALRNQGTCPTRRRSRNRWR